jgi:hypothetical protein
MTAPLASRGDGRSGNDARDDEEEGDDFFEGRFVHE